MQEITASNCWFLRMLKKITTALKSLFAKTKAPSQKEMDE